MQARPTTVTVVWKPVCAAEGHIPLLAFLSATKNVVNELLLLSASVFRYTAEFNLLFHLPLLCFKFLKGFLSLKMAPVSLVEIFMNHYKKKELQSDSFPSQERAVPQTVISFSVSLPIHYWKMKRNS